MAETLTLSVDEIAQDVFDALKVQVPMLASIGTDMSSATAKKDDTIKARISKVPADAAYDANTGYENGANDAADLVVDVPVTLDQHRHVTVSLGYLTAIASKIDIYNESIKNMAFGLARPIVQHLLGKVVAANFSERTIEPIISVSAETLGKVTKAMNVKGAAPIGRFGIVNSDVFEALDNDARISDKNFHGQQKQGNAYGVLRGVKGFDAIYEYPDLPANGENLSGYFGSRVGLVFASRIPNDPSVIAKAAGIPEIASFEVVTDPDSGLSMLAIKWMKAGTFDVKTTFTLVYGAAAGKQAQDAGEICDYNGHRLVTAG